MSGSLRICLIWNSNFAVLGDIPSRAAFGKGIQSQFDASTNSATIIGSGSKHDITTRNQRRWQIVEGNNCSRPPALPVPHTAGTRSDWFQHDAKGDFPSSQATSHFQYSNGNLLEDLFTRVLSTYTSRALVALIGSQLTIVHIT